MVKLSILDQSPISSGMSAQEALQMTVQLAKLGEELGYVRFWIAEHHDLFGLACPNPDVMLGVIGSQTKSITIGSGAVLLPYYKPFRVAETYNLLATLFPGRIDLGLGRAPGGSAEVSLALSDNYLKQVGKYAEHIDELLHFLHGTMPKEHIFSKIKPSPVPDIPPKVWVLGTSNKSGELAAQKGLPYAFGHFMASVNGKKIVNHYRKSFVQQHDDNPYVIVAVHVICAHTTDKANELAESTLAWSVMQEKSNEDLTIPSIDEVNKHVWTEAELEKMEKRKQKMIIGNPTEVKEKLQRLANVYDADELMVVTITYDHKDKFNSYRLLAEQMW